MVRVRVAGAAVWRVLRSYAMSLVFGRIGARFVIEYASGVEVVATLRTPYREHDESEVLPPIDPLAALVRLESALRASVDELCSDAREQGVIP
jgi:hypothetical protein